MPCNILNGQKKLGCKSYSTLDAISKYTERQKTKLSWELPRKSFSRKTFFGLRHAFLPHELVSQPKFLGCTDTYSAPLCALRASKNSPRCTMPACLSLKVMLHGTIRNAGRLLEQHSVAMLDQCSNHSKQCRNNVATLCCAKNRLCESSLVTSP